MGFLLVNYAFQPDDMILAENTITSLTSTNVKLKRLFRFDTHLNFTWLPDHHLTFHWRSPDVNMKFTWHSPDHHLTFPWPQFDWVGGWVGCPTHYRPQGHLWGLRFDVRDNLSLTISSLTLQSNAKATCCLNSYCTRYFMIWSTLTSVPSECPR